MAAPMGCALFWPNWVKHNRPLGALALATANVDPGNESTCRVCRRETLHANSILQEGNTGSRVNSTMVSICCAPSKKMDPGQTLGPPGVFIGRGTPHSSLRAAVHYKMWRHLLDNKVLGEACGARRE